jgi:hypothetical protein
MDLQQEEVDKASSGLEDPSVATTMQVPIVDEAVAAEDAEGPGEDGMDSDGTRRSEDISGRGSPDDWLMIGAVDAEMDLALEAAGIGASLVAQVNGEDPTQQQIPPHSDDGVEEGQDEKVNEYDEDKFGDLVVESSVPLPYAVVAQEEELEGASACTASFGDEVVVDEEDACKGQDTIARIDDLTRFDGAPPKPEPSSSPEACPALVEAVGEESADDSAALRARVEKLEAELAQRRSDVQTLEKHCVRVENRLQEAEAVVASALACLGLTRDRMTALAASTQDTLSRLAPHATVASHSDAKEDQDVSPPPSSAPWGGASVRIEEPPRLVLPAVMGDIDRAFAAVERSTSSALSELQGHVVAANEAVKVHAILPEATPIASGTEDVAAPDAERVPSHTLRNGDGNRDKGDRIAVRAFAEGDVVMFFPTPRGDYVAFNVGAPNYFLSEESKALIGMLTTSEATFLLLCCDLYLFCLDVLLEPNQVTTSTSKRCMCLDASCS